MLPLPKRFHRADIRQVELLWRADHFQLAMTVAEAVAPAPRAEGQVAGVDLGEVNVAAVCTQDGHALVVSGRLRWSGRCNLQSPLVAHCDWGSHPRKRWLALANPSERGYTAHPPELAGPPETLLARLRAVAQGAPVLLGLDLPLGLPLAYAERAGVEHFPALLPSLGRGAWREFYVPAAQPEQISLARPFYPARPGAARREHLVRALELGAPNDLLRRCDRATGTRRAGCPLFWTLGPQQVGKAAISAWRDVLGPALQAGEDLAIWPCDGTLTHLLRPGRIVVAEVYPGECYAHLGATPGRGGKRSQAGRIAAAQGLLTWAERAAVTLTPALREAITAGFGPRPDADDPFDTAVGLLGALNVVFGLRPAGEPTDERLRRVEGWILGQEYVP